MGMIQTDKCFITGLDVTNIPGERDIYEYNLTLEGKTLGLMLGRGIKSLLGKLKRFFRHFYSTINGL